jgi:hypothetical protein
MLVLIPVFWMLLSLNQVGAIDSGAGADQFRRASPYSSPPMTGKPIKIPPKKV